ncbi:MAG TPA: signal peptide peptidase SppA [Flavisolibacter sp.]|jgi:protease-4
MRSFFKMFFASCLGTVVGLFLLVLIGGFLLVGAVSALSAGDKQEVADKSVLSIQLGQNFTDQAQSNPLGSLTGDAESIPGIYDVVRLIRKAKTDDNIEGIYLDANGSGNSFASSDELRNALIDFKKSKKFILAHGDVISQGAYFVASVADKIYANASGAVDWSGYNMDVVFVKGTLDKLGIEPQIFYAGKFKSATETFRTTQMTEENKLQTREWLGDLYQYFLAKTGEARRLDTATLHDLANTGAIQTPQDALNARLIDGLRFESDVKDEMKRKLGIEKHGKLNLVPITKYADAVAFKQSGSDRIALIYAEGNIVDGAGGSGAIGSREYVDMVRKARLDKSIKAIVLRINSGGGSALASENIWKELSLAKAEKPLVVSFGDVAASGGYYIAAPADSIFASANTITGSIGVFGIVPNMQGFFNNKLGITFDGVKTANYADAGAVYRPLNEAEKGFVQQGIDRIYLQFKQRVAQGRKKDIAFIDSIAQGRVWSGEDALRLGLVDKIGGLEDAVLCAARMAKVKAYRLREYPEKGNWLNEFMGRKSDEPAAQIKAQLGEEGFRIFQQMSEVKQMVNTPQTRLPFQFFIR